MFGIVAALFSAMFLTLADAGKKRLTQSYDIYLIVWITCAVGCLVNLFYLALFGFPEIKWEPLLTVFLPCTILFFFSEIFFVLAIKHSELSVVMPFAAFKPLAAGVVAYLVYGELPTAGSLVGVLPVMLGVYVIYLEPGRGMLYPLYNAFREKGPRYLLACLFITAGSAVLQRFGSQASSPIFFTTLLLFGQCLIFGVIIWRNGSRLNQLMRDHLGYSLITGALWGLGITALYIAWNNTLIVYVSVVALLQVILSVPIGHYYFGEGAALKRFEAAALMFGGAVIMVVYG